MGKPRLLLVENDEDIVSQMRWALSKEYEVLACSDREGAMLALSSEPAPEIVALDLGLPPDESGTKEGMECLREILLQDPFIKVIIITGNTEKANALECISIGAYDCLYKPIELDELRVLLKRARHVSSLERENRKLRTRVEEDSLFGDILGTSRMMQEVFSTIKKVAPTDVPVLITGESGTGKELVARAVHKRSNRSESPFIPINCGAIPENLLESELFGYEKGALTGAGSRKLGKLELAEGGTLFFDEVGELPLMLQVKLLRFLQDQVVERIGAKVGKKVDVRVLAATNKDLKGEVEKGTFREDIFYRLALIHIEIPPLREREDDIMLCAMAFLQRFSSQYKKQFKGFSTEGVNAIMAYGWPGNVRELENRVKRAVIMAEGKRVGPEDLALSAGTTSLDNEAQTDTLKEVRENAEKERITSALLNHSGNISRAAKELDVTRPTLYDLIKRYNIKEKKG